MTTVYLFKEDGAEYKGKRLFLKKVREEVDTELLYELRKRTYPSEEEARKSTKFLVFFETMQIASAPHNAIGCSTA